jgi:hypothetical protein
MRTAIQPGRPTVVYAWDDRDEQDGAIEPWRVAIREYPTIEEANRAVLDGHLARAVKAARSEPRDRVTPLEEVMTQNTPAGARARERVLGG